VPLELPPHAAKALQRQNPFARQYLSFLVVQSRTMVPRRKFSDR
jgi:hypothetical protein